MDCISVYMAGVKNVLATSGTAFTEMQIRLLSRFTKRVVVNFDPDAAGSNAAEKSIAMLTEEEFDVRVVTLEGGLDPDRYVREHGVQEYMAALRGAKRHSDYLIDSARQQFPARTADAKVKAMNFLLPHIRRMPNRIQRDEFAADAAQKLGIDSALLRQELKQAAAARLESVPQFRQEPISENEKILLRALVLGEDDPARQLASEQLSMHPEWFAELPMADILESLSQAPAPENPLDAAPTNESRAQLAIALQHTHGEKEPPLLHQVRDALEALDTRRMQRRQRELRSQIAEADRRGDSAMLDQFMMEKMAIDKKLRER
jgi:DNA primase